MAFSGSKLSCSKYSIYKSKGKSLLEGKGVFNPSFGLSSKVSVDHINTPCFLPCPCATQKGGCVESRNSSDTGIGTKKQMEDDGATRVRSIMTCTERSKGTHQEKWLPMNTPGFCKNAASPIFPVSNLSIPALKCRIPPNVSSGHRLTKSIYSD